MMTGGSDATPPTTNVFCIRGRVVRLPNFLPIKGWEVDETRKGYLRYNSNGKRHGIKRRTRAHREVMARLIGRPLTDDEHVHHQDFDKLNCCPCNLILMPVALNPAGNIGVRDPYTGYFMSPDKYVERYGELKYCPPLNNDDAPDWVREIEA